MAPQSFFREMFFIFRCFLFFFCCRGAEQINTLLEYSKKKEVLPAIVAKWGRKWDDRDAEGTIS